MKKRILSLLLAAALCVSLLPAKAMAAENTSNATAANLKVAEDSSNAAAANLKVAEDTSAAVTTNLNAAEDTSAAAAANLSVASDTTNALNTVIQNTAEPAVSSAKGTDRSATDFAHSIVCNVDGPGSAYLSAYIAREGTAISVTAAPEDQCELVYIDVYDDQGTRIFLSEFGLTEYVFKMPARDVMITVVFRPINDNHAYRIIMESGGEGYGVLDVPNPESVQAGTPVVVSAHTDDGNVINDPRVHGLGVRVTARDKFGNYVTLPNSTSFPSFGNAFSVIQYHFEMLPMDVYLHVEVRARPFDIHVTSVGDGAGAAAFSGTWDLGPWGGDLITISANQPAEIWDDLNGGMYYVESISVKDADGNDVSVIGKDSFRMPNSDAYVTAVVKYHPQRCNITVNVEGEGSIRVLPMLGINEAHNQSAPGTTVVLEAQTDELHELVYVSIQGEDGSKVPVSENMNSFIMPSCDVTVNAVFRPINSEASYSITVIPALNGTGLPEVNGVQTNEAKAGETVFIRPSINLPPSYFANLDTLPVIADITVEDCFGCPVETLSRYEWYKNVLRTYHDQFVMPPVDVVIHVEIHTDDPLRIDCAASGGYLLTDCPAASSLRPWPYEGDLINISWAPYLDFEDLNDNPENYYLESLVVKDAFGNEVPLLIMSGKWCYRQPATDVTIYGVIKKNDNNFGGTYRVTLSPGTGSGAPIVYEASYGTTALNTEDYQFYLETPGNRPGFRLHNNVCPDSFTAPEWCVFDGWEGVTNDAGYNLLTSRDTVFTAKWKYIETSFEFTTDDMWYSDGQLHVAATATELTPGIFQDQWGRNLITEQYSVNFLPATLTNGDGSSLSIAVSGDSRVWFPEEGHTTIVDYTVDPTSWERAVPGTIYRSGEITTKVQLWRYEWWGSELHRCTSASITKSYQLTLVKPGYRLSAEALTLTGPDETHFECNLTALGLGRVPALDGSGAIGQANGIRFEWDTGGKLTGPEGQEIPFTVWSDPYTVFTAAGDDVGPNLQIDSETYWGARTGLYTGELHYTAYYTLEGSEATPVAGSGVIQLSMNITEQGIHYHDLLSDGIVVFYMEDINGLYPVTKAYVGDRILVSANEAAVPERYTATFFESEDVDLEYVNSDFNVFTMPDKPVRVSVYLDPIVLGTPYYTVSFLDEAGNVLQTGQVKEGNTPAYTGNTPEKEENIGYTYSFAGWFPEIVPATADAVYQATFTATAKEYTVRFVNADGTELQSSSVIYGELPPVPSALPVKASDPQYTYRFAGWTPAIQTVSGDATYTATYTASLRSYQVWFVNRGGAALQVSEVPFGEMPEYKGETPTLATDECYIYTFSGWSPQIDTVIGYTVYTAQYETEAILYNVTVNGGAGNGSYFFGDNVTIRANEPEAGKQFIGWTGTDGLTFTEGSAETLAATFIMPAQDLTLTALYEDIPVTWYPLTGEYLMFFDEEFNVITEAAEGQTVTVSADPESFPAGMYFTGEYRSDEVTVQTGESRDGSFTMPAGAVTVTAVLAEQEAYYDLLLADDASVTLPAEMGWLLLSNEYSAYDAENDRYVLDLNRDGEPDVLLDPENNTAQRLPGADALQGSTTLSIDYPEPYRYKAVCIRFSENQTAGPVIVQEPADAEAPLGEIVRTTVIAEGEGLKYQWYVREPNGSECKSKIKRNTYFITLTKNKIGRQVWCVITDKYGNTVTTRTATLSAAMPEDYVYPYISQQPVNGYADPGQEAFVTFEAVGYGELTYQWYFQNRDADPGKWSKSGIRGVDANTYSCTLNSTRNGRRVYCVVTDAWGNWIQTDCVTVGYAYPEGYERPSITAEPQDAFAGLGELAVTSFTAKGEGLSYQWYFRANENASWSRSSLKGDTYSLTMTVAKSGRQVKCVVTDRFGAKAETQVVTLTLRQPEGYTLHVVAQPESCTVARGESARARFVVEGAGLSYRWYGIDPGQDEVWTSAIRKSTYSIKMSAAKSGRQIYCVVTDVYGNTVTSNTVTLSMREG